MKRGPSALRPTQRLKTSGYRLSIHPIHSAVSQHPGIPASLPLARMKSYMIHVRGKAFNTDAEGRTFGTILSVTQG